MTSPIVSTKTLLKSSVAAVAIASVVIVCFILPAEYNIDPTHIGQKLGLTALAHFDVETTATAKNTLTEAQGRRTIEVLVPAGKGIEYKFHMAQYEKMTYEWLSNGDPLYFDLHGEPEGDTSGYFESYAIATLSAMKGSFTAPFNGAHGWYWKNSSSQAVVVTLIVEGQYKIIGLK